MTMSIRLIISTILLFVIISQSLGAQRNKRIIWGSPLFSYDSPFKVVGYMAYITQGNFYSFNLESIWNKITGGIPDPAPESSLRCGGALITPNVVHTACHCLVDYFRINDTYMEGRIKSLWETWSTVHVGYTMVSSMSFNDGAWIKSAIAHSKCGKIRDVNTFDFGLIITDRPVKLRLLHMKVAPVQTASSLAKDYYNTMKLQSACLFVGFGRYRYTDTTRTIIDPIKSPILQHGWRTFDNYYDCKEYAEDKLMWSNMAYEDFATWMCSIFFGKMRAQLAPGDSGSPVTCNNVRVGLVSSGTEYPRNPKSVGMISSLAFAVEYNAAEYRNRLEENIRQYSEGQSDMRPTAEYTVLPPGKTIGSLDDWRRW